MRLRLLASCLLLPAAAASAAPDPVARRNLEQAERAQAAQQAASLAAAERARAAQAEVLQLAQARIEAVDRLRATEQEVTDAAGRVEELAERRAAAERRLVARAAALGPVLPLIERLTLYPVETLLAANMPADAALRGLLVLRGLTRQMERDAAAMQAEQAEVRRLARAVEAELAPLRAAQAAQQVQAAVLDRQLAASRAAGRLLDASARETARRVASAAAQARTLRAAVAQLEAEQARAEARTRAEASREERRRTVAAAPPRPRVDAPPAETAGMVRTPLAGTVVRSWGERTEAGPASGVLLRGAPGARVTAPCAGRVAFAGPFRSFGLLVILECGGGTHVVLSGLDRLDAEVGDKLRAGEPVGVMPAWDPQRPGARPSLYVELRRDGKPMDPAPFLRAQ